MPHLLETLQSPKTASEDEDFGGKRVRALNRQEQIYFEAARLFVEKGFDGASMSDLAKAVGVTKAGLYHFVESKEELLYTIMSFGMDRLAETVTDPGRAIADPYERLETMVRLHVRNIGEAQTEHGNPITMVVNESAGLSDEHRAEIDARKRDYVDLMRHTLDELSAAGRLREGMDTTVAAFSLIGMVIWITHWHRPGGRLSFEAVEDQLVGLALNAVLKH
jgi:TetR/AcrR family transcriptional regulator, cholesterol catabolism regulator